MDQNNELKNLVNLAKTGHWPLFFSEWFYESIPTDQYQKMSLKTAKDSVEKVLGSVSRHKSIDRKKDALFALKTEDRKTFILAFYKLVESELMDETKTLQ